MSIWFIVLLLIIGIEIGMTVESILNHRTNKNPLTKENIISCFENVDWTRHRFSSNGVMFKADDGTERFYKVDSIDKAIDKLQKLLNEN